MRRAVEAGHVVGRVEIGGPHSGDGPIRVTLIAEATAPIGIDSVVITRH